MNNTALATATHKGFQKLSDGTKHSSGRLNDQQMEGQDRLKEVI